MLQSRITDHQRGQFKIACLKLQTIKLTVYFNSAWGELSNTENVPQASSQVAWFQTKLSKSDNNPTPSLSNYNSPYS